MYSAPDFCWPGARESIALAQLRSLVHDREHVSQFLRFWRRLRASFIPPRGKILFTIPNGHIGIKVQWNHFLITKIGESHRTLSHDVNIVFTIATSLLRGFETHAKSA